MKEYCKSIGVYPIGNLTLSNTTMACMESMHTNPTPLWTGIVRDLYEKKEQGITFLVLILSKYIRISNYLICLSTTIYNVICYTFSCKA